MLTYITRRILYSVPVLFVSSFLCFLFVSYPSDPLGQIHLIPRISQQTIDNLTHQYQLDQPIPLRYFYWLPSVFTEKFGQSPIPPQPIWPDITRTLGHTLQVVLVSQLLALFLGVIVGIYSAIRQY